MRNLEELDRYRVDMSDHYGSVGDHGNGVFAINSKIDGTTLHIIASNGGDWDHVSISHRKRVPNWYEMEQIKKMFFEPDETCMQLHVPASDHINNHANVLHLWRPQLLEIPRPPAIMVGIEGVTNARAIHSRQSKNLTNHSRPSKNLTNLAVAAIFAATAFK